MLTVIPSAGLANRIRVICSVYEYARQHNIKLKIKWIREKGFNARFSDLFIPSPNLVVDERSILNYFLYTPPNLRNLYIPNITNRIFNIKPTIEISRDELARINISSDATVITHSQQYKMAPIQDLLHPVETLKNKIDNIISMYSGRVIGIHIRRTDNIKAIQSSGINTFERRIIDELSRDSNARFFLCSDDNRVKNYFKKRYPEVITYDSKLSRFSRTGIEDAVVELWALAGTSEIWGSYYSSYSEIAALIHGIPLHIIKN